MQKFYDMAAFGGGGKQPSVLESTLETSTNIICECDQHILHVVNSVDIYAHPDNTKQVIQEIYLSMFTNGAIGRPFFKRFKVALNYLFTGTMFRDQLSLTPEEAAKLRDFLRDNIIYDPKKP